MKMSQEPGPKVLSVDTSTPRGSVALLQGSTLRAEIRFHSETTHSACLLQAIERVLCTSDTELDQLQLVTVGVGPGSFTGIRIGMATAIGFAQSLAVPLAGVSGLDALAYQLTFLRMRIGIVLDAQRFQVYYAEYDMRSPRARVHSQPALWTPRALDRYLGSRRVYLAGDGVTRYGRELRVSRSGRRQQATVDLFLASAIARVALGRRRSWKRGLSLKMEPLYIRLPDALRKN